MHQNKVEVQYFKELQVAMAKRRKTASHKYLVTKGNKIGPAGIQKESTTKVGPLSD